MKKRKAQVFAVPGYETSDGKHEVVYAKNGDLNHGTRKTFKKWSDAITFANKIGRQLKAEVLIHSYGKKSSTLHDYSREKTCNKAFGGTGISKAQIRKLGL